jgi:flagella basal body P-ring formation protein FlgA
MMRHAITHEHAEPHAPGVDARRLATIALLALVYAVAAFWPRESHGQTIGPASGPVAHAADQDVVRLRPLVIVDAGTTLTLGQVADLHGPRGAMLADVPLGPATPGRIVRLDDVRRAIEASGRVSPALLRVQGAACEVRGAAPAPTLNARTPDGPPPIREGSIGAAIPTRLADLLGVHPADVRVTFEGSDSALLATPVGDGVLTIAPQGEGERVSLSVRLYRGDAIVASGSVRARVEVRRRVLVARGVLARGDVVTPESVVEEQRHLPLDAAPAGDDAIGMTVRSRIGAGEVVRTRDVESPIVVRRGDLIGVDCVSGGFVVRTTARAMEVGREGQVITLQALNSKHTFRARVARPGLAVVVVGETQ